MHGGGPLRAPQWRARREPSAGGRWGRPPVAVQRAAAAAASDAWIQSSDPTPPPAVRLSSSPARPTALSSSSSSSPPPPPPPIPNKSSLSSSSLSAPAAAAARRLLLFASPPPPLAPLVEDDAATEEVAPLSARPWKTMDVRSACVSAKRGGAKQQKRRHRPLDTAGFLALSPPPLLPLGLFLDPAVLGHGEGFERRAEPHHHRLPVERRERLCKRRRQRG